MNSLKENLYNIMKNVEAHEGSKENVLEVCIKQKLDISLNNYMIKLQDLCYEFKNRNALNLMKKLAKQFKK